MSFVFVAATLNAQKITILEVPNGINVLPTAISPSGEIVGSYQDTSTNEYRAFIRKPDGKVTTFDDPNAVYPTPTAVNSSGVIAGHEDVIIDRGLLSQQEGFVRSPNESTITSFDPSPLVAPDDPDVTVTGINDRGVVVGVYSYTLLSVASFLRAPDGTITVVDLVGEPTAAPGTYITAINDAGQCAGDYSPTVDGPLSGFLRQPDGSITTFTVLNADNGTYPEAINAKGQVAGHWADSKGDFHGFLRKADNHTTIIDYPGASSTSVLGIDSRGRVAGIYSLSPSASYAFVRDEDGHFATLDVPTSPSTNVTGMNPSGEIVGYYNDANGTHAWLLKLDHDDDHDHYHDHE